MFTYLREKHKQENRFCFRVQYYEVFLTPTNFFHFIFALKYFSFFCKKVWNDTK